MTKLFGLAPTQVWDAQGKLEVGAYRGGLADVDIGAKSLMAKALEKRWQHLSLATEELLLSLSLVDLGYAASGFVSVADLKANRFQYDLSYLAAPKLMVRVNRKPGRGCDARFWLPTQAEMSLKRGTTSTRYQLKIAAAGLQVDATLEAQAAPPPLLVIGDPVPGAAMVTQKTPLLRVSGKLSIPEGRFNLAGGWASLDFTTGVLPRPTHWQWASGLGVDTQGRPMAFNLADGNNLGSVSENAVWNAEEIVLAPAPRFEWDREHPDRPWRVLSDDGQVELQFTPRLVHRETKNYGLLETRFVQVLGKYDGKVLGREVRELAGIAEDQWAKW